MFLFSVGVVGFFNGADFGLNFDFVSPPKTNELLFVVTEFFFAVLAREASVALFAHALGVTPKRQFPTNENHQRQQKQTPRVPMENENKRGKQHSEIPVVDTAGGATFVFHKPSLEGAEKENANHIAHSIRQAYQNENILINKMKEI